MTTLLVLLALGVAFAALTAALKLDTLGPALLLALLGLGLLFAAAATAPDLPADECSPATVEAID